MMTNDKWFEMLFQLKLPTRKPLRNYSECALSVCMQRPPGNLDRKLRKGLMHDYLFKLRCRCRSDWVTDGG